MRHVVILLIVGAFATPVGWSKPLIEVKDRLEVNWSTLRVKFYGEAKADLNSDPSYKDAERAAWRDGLKYITQAVRDIYIAQNESLFEDTAALSKAAEAAAQKIATTTFSYNTTYYSDGKVRVYLENTLPRAVASDAIRFRIKEALDPGMIKHSGVLFEVSRDVKPSATYKIVDENGETLFDAKEMAEASFRKNLMGRWYRQPRRSEVSQAVGSLPVKLALIAQSPGVFKIDAKQWEKALEGHKALLRSGRIALALP